MSCEYFLSFYASCFYSSMLIPVTLCISFPIPKFLCSQVLIICYVSLPQYFGHFIVIIFLFSSMTFSFSKLSSIIEWDDSKWDFHTEFRHILLYLVDGARYSYLVHFEEYGIVLHEYIYAYIYTNVLMYYVGIPYTFGAASDYRRLHRQDSDICLGFWWSPVDYWIGFNFLSARFGRLKLGYILYISWLLYSWLWIIQLVCRRCFSILILFGCAEDLARFSP